MVTMRMSRAMIQASSSRLERAPETGDALCSQPTISRMENMADTRSLVRMQHELIRVYCKSFKRAPANDGAGYRRDL